MTSTAYTYCLTVACPEALIAAANHLSVAIGESAGDFHTFQQADWEDSSGNKYAVACMRCTATLFAYAGTVLEYRDFAPETWDRELAEEAQAAVVLWLGEGAMPTALPSKITGLVLDDPYQAIQLLGLTRVTEE